MANESVDWTLDGLDNPFTIQHRLLERFKNDSGGVIVDNNNPACILMEGFATLSSSQLRMMDENVRPAIYPARAESMDDLLKHISDYDYVDIFSSPCSATITLVVEKSYVITHSVEVPGKNYKKMEIPRSTTIKLGEHTFGLYYPIEIRTNEKSGRFSVLYNDTDVRGNKQINPLRRLETNVLDFEFREFGGHKLAYIKVPVYQFEITGHDSVLMNASGYKNIIPYSNKFYALRCWADVLQNFGHDDSEEDIFKRVELNLAVSGQTYDPTVPTVVFTPDTDNNVLKVEVPYVYFSEGRIRGTLHVDVYTTEGALDYQVPYGTNETCQIDMFTNISEDDEDLFSATMYAEPFRQMPALNAFPITSHIVGGSNGLTYEEIRSRIIHGVKTTLLQTPGDIDAYFASMGYTATLYKDGITDRVFIVHATVRDTSGVVVGADTISTLIDFSKVDDYETIVKSDAVDTYTILPSTLYKFDTDRKICVPLTDVERAAINNKSPSDKVEEFNSNIYTMSPFHLQVDTSKRYPSTITYDMLQVKRVSRTFVEARDDQYGLALNGVNLDVDRRAGDVKDRYRMTLRVCRVGFGSEVPVMETDPTSQGEKKIRVLIGLKNDDGEYRWTEALHIGNEVGDSDNGDNEIFECYFTPNYIFHQANNDHTVQMAFWDNNSFSDYFLRSECRIILLLRNSISFTDETTGETITFDGDQHLETPFNSGSIVLPTSKSTPINSMSGMNGYVAMSEHSCVFQFGSVVDELDQRIHLSYSEAEYASHKTTKFSVCQDDIYARDAYGQLITEFKYSETTDTVYKSGKFYFSKNADNTYTQKSVTVGATVEAGTYERIIEITKVTSKGTLKCMTNKSAELVYINNDTLSNYLGCTAIDDKTGKEFKVTEESAASYIAKGTGMSIKDAPLVPKFEIETAAADGAGIYELTEASGVRSGISSMYDVWRLTGANVDDTKIVTVNALKFVLDNLLVTNESLSGDVDPINSLYGAGIEYEPGTFLVLTNDSSAPKSVQLGTFGEIPVNGVYTSLYYKLRNRTSSEMGKISESEVWMCIARAKTIEDIKAVVDADNSSEDGAIPKYYGFAYVLGNGNKNSYFAFLTTNSLTSSSVNYFETKDTTAIATKSYYLNIDGEFRLAYEEDFNDDGSFMPEKKYYEMEVSMRSFATPDFTKFELTAWESHIDYKVSTDTVAVANRKYYYLEAEAYVNGIRKWMPLEVEVGTAMDLAIDKSETGDGKIYYAITVAEALENGSEFGWESRGNRWPWDVTEWMIVDQDKHCLTLDETFSINQMYDRIRRYTDYSNKMVIIDENGKPLRDVEKPRYIQYLIDMMQLDAKLAQVTVTREDLDVGSNFGDDGANSNKFPSTVVTVLRTHFDNVGNARDSMFTNTRLFFEPVKSLGYGEFNVGNNVIKTMPLDIGISFRLHVTKDVYEDDILLIQLKNRIIEIIDDHIDKGGYVNCAEIANSIMLEMSGSIKYVDILGINGDKELQTMKSDNPEVRPHLKSKLVLLDDGVTIDSTRGIEIETVIND